MCDENQRAHIAALRAVADDFDQIVATLNIPLKVFKNDRSTYLGYDIEGMKQRIKGLIDCGDQGSLASLTRLKIDLKAMFPFSVELLSKLFQEQGWIRKILNENFYSQFPEPRDEALERTWEATLRNARNWSGAESWYPKITYARFQSNFKRLCVAESKLSKRETPFSKFDGDDSGAPFANSIEDTKSTNVVAYELSLEKWKSSLTAEELAAVDAFQKAGSIAGAANMLDVSRYRVQKQLASAARKFKGELGYE